MNKIYLILFLFFYTYPLLGKDIQYQDLTNENGYYFKSDDDSIYTGKTINYSKRTLLKIERDFKNGLLVQEIIYKAQKYIYTNEYTYLDNGKYFANGQARKKITYKNQRSDASLEWYYENGNIKTIGNSINNKRDGTWIWYFNNGKIQEKGNYKDGKKEGELLFYYESGQLERKVNYKNDSKEGMDEEFFKNGKIKIQINFKNNLREGETKFFYETGQLFLINRYVLGKKSGLSEVYYKNSNLKSISKYRNNEKIGVSIFYKNNSEIFKNGPWQDFFPYFPDKVWSEGNIKNGKQEGEWKSYYFWSTGYIKYIINYEKGIRNGVFKSYKPDHVLEYTKIYKDGLVISCEGLCE